MSVAIVPPELLEAVDRYLMQEALKRRGRVLTALERRLRTALATAWRREGAALVRRLEAGRDRWSALEASRTRRAIAITQDELDILYGNVSETMRRVFEAPIQSVVEAAFVKGAAATASTLGGTVSLDLANPRAVAFLERRGAARVTAIADATRERLRHVLAASVERGDSYTALAEEIDQMFRGFGQAMPQRHIATRAELVAVTETGEAYAAGNRELAQQVQQAGQRLEKHWLTADDDRVDPDCEANEEAGWLDLDEPYPSGHQRPLAHPACRCDEAHRTVS